jgi:hypothetical protein
MAHFRNVQSKLDPDVIGSHLWPEGDIVLKISIETAINSFRTLKSEETSSFHTRLLMLKFNFLLSSNILFAEGLYTSPLGLNFTLNGALLLILL